MNKPAPKKRLGDQLVDKGLISQDQVMIAITEQKKTGKPLGQALVDLGFITEAVMRDMLGEVLGRESIDLANVVPDSEAISLVPKNLAVRHNVLPVSFDIESRSLQIAVTDIYDVMVLDRIRANIPSDVDLSPILAAEGEIRAAIDHFYGYELSVDGILREIETGVVDYQSLDAEGEEYSQPLVRLVDAILTDAVKEILPIFTLSQSPGF